MTGNEILKQAYVLLNYTDANGNINAGNNANLSKRALPIINQVYADLWQPRVANAKFEALTSTNQPLDLDDYVAINIMPYGVAMFLAQSDGDADNQAIYSNIYNQRRCASVTQSERILDRLPITFM
jgi:hypothetical protein